LKIVTEDENHQGTKRIFGVPMPYIKSDAANKAYVDQKAGSGGSTSQIDGGRQDTDFSDGPLINCGGVT